MKKLFTLLFALTLIFTFTGMALANDLNDHPDGDGAVISTGSFNIGAGSFGAGCDIDWKKIPNGGAFGISGAGGLAGASAYGYIDGGTTSGDVYTIGGGLSGTDAYRWTPKDQDENPLGDKRIGVGSHSENEAITGAGAGIGVDPNGFGNAATQICGAATQGTLNASYVTESPRYFDTEGFSGGIAGQGSIGCFHGEGSINTGSTPLGVEIDAEIAMDGYSYSESYRFVGWHNGYKTEGMGTYVGAGTDIESYGYGVGYVVNGYEPNGNPGPPGPPAYSNVDGGWTAGGFAATATVQNAPGIGGAGAYAVGSYSGSGPLNTNYTGSANGYSATSVTTAKNMNGSINTASAGMSVTSTVH